VFSQCHIQSGSYLISPKFVHYIATRTYIAENTFFLHCLSLVWNYFIFHKVNVRRLASEMTFLLFLHFDMKVLQANTCGVFDVTAVILQLFFFFLPRIIFPVTPRSGSCKCFNIPFEAHLCDILCGLRN
jgi:hypothetical protein